MELMILRMKGKEYYAGFNRHEWLAFINADEYGKFLNMLEGKRGYFEVFADGAAYAIAFIDLKTAKALDKEFGFEGSFIRAFKERVVK